MNKRNHARTTVVVAAMSTFAALGAWHYAPMLFGLVEPVAGGGGMRLPGDPAAYLVVAACGFGFGALAGLKLAQEMSGESKTAKDEEFDPAKPVDTSIRSVE